ncbi:MAG TPA: peptidylprolyl isomerase [Candidatus Fimenecus excrementigallinarum]|uniref:Peptidyl-prolyl cis-trans isomerase n=1 Tax=Candidatus Fimenecus excrementigallinarum TaxID=2840816 RepID=A0A9D1IDL9_9FIRM|nr:peptidylprolyl isomerase [Candidatus Fimenecus excrementigallinarum]
MLQTELPKAGEEIAEIQTNMGTVRVRLFPEYAPKAVENFKTHAKNGYYNGLIFHRVIQDFMIQGGDPTGSGMGGESIWGESFEDEFTPLLHNLRGALSMANAGPGTNGSQFFIVQASEVSSDMLDQLEAASEEAFPTECVRAYETLGGTPWLDYHHTVFGQVFDGMDVVDAIAAVPVDFFMNKPTRDVVMESVAIVPYEEK